MSRTFFYDNVDPDAFVSPPLWMNIGTMRDARDHLQNCVYERFKGYIESTNKRFEKLENLISVSALSSFER